MPFPDTGPPAECFPTLSDLRAERLDRRAARLGKAQARIDAALDEIGYRVGRMPTEAAGATDDDVLGVEAVAIALEAAKAVAEARA